MSVIAAIDCGTHSIRLLIADVEETADGAGGVILRDRERLMEIVELGKGVDKSKHLREESLQRTFAQIERYSRLIADAGAQSVRMVATSASRDADNSEIFIEGVRQRLGIIPEVISGKEEAALSFTGATFAHAEAGQSTLVVDIGGGSTEFAFGQGSTLLDTISLDMGCTRVTERYLKPSWDDFQRPHADALAAATGFIDETILRADAQLDFSRLDKLIGVAGTVTTVTALSLDLPAYQPERIDGAQLPPEKVLKVARELVESTGEQRRAYPAMHPKRVDVIAGGALVWSRIVKRVHERARGGAGLPTVVTSEHDILDGIVLSQVPQL